MLYPLSYLIFLASTGRVATLHIPRDPGTSQIRIPTTTDFPAPGTTDTSSEIAIQYSEYIQNCGSDMVDAQQVAVSDYQFEFKKDPGDPNSPDFIAWAYNHDSSYHNSYRVCIDQEGRYQALLATFVPETAFSSSTSGPTTTVAQSPLTSTSTSLPSGGASTGAASSNGPEIFLVLIGLLVANAGLRC
ncbi:hypothetical protein DFH09DRAFT_1074561 [Mycena vulgaris]|nr:hypothetical protein DFH09DRAFT_1074561 [Mycena vulgaris]